MGRLEGKRAIVTAAGQGIGRATAQAFAREGAVVFASDINERPLASLKGEAEGISTQRLDVTDAKAVGDYVAGLGRVDVLVNVAAQFHVWEFLWPELEANTTWWPDGSKGGKIQLLLTPGIIFGRFTIKDRVRFIIGFYDRIEGISTLDAPRKLGQPHWDTNTPFEVVEQITAPEGSASSRSGSSHGRSPTSR